MSIEYVNRKVWKYKLNKSATLHTGIDVGRKCVLDFLHVYPSGNIHIFSGYCWDGPSGPTIDTKNSIRASLYHDVLYQLIREGVLDPKCRKRADEIFYETCIEDGMNKVRAWSWYKALRLAGGKATQSDVLTAP